MSRRATRMPASGCQRIRGERGVLDSRSKPRLPCTHFRVLRASTRGRLAVLSVLLSLSVVPPVSPTTRAQEEAPFLPAWHFFQSATTLEAIGQLGQARRAIATSLRLEPHNKEYARVKTRIYRAHINATRWHQAHQLSLTLKVALLPTVFIPSAYQCSCQ